MKRKLTSVATINSKTYRFSSYLEASLSLASARFAVFSIDHMKELFTVVFLITCFSTYAQQVLTVKVLDHNTSEVLPGANVQVGETSKGGTANKDGIIELRGLPEGKIFLKITFVGYRDTIVSVTLPHDEILRIGLARAEQNLEEIIVSSTRTDQHIEDLPLKVEVLGLAEMDEESTLVPGNVASILGDLAVITIQRTNPINGNDAIRMQGLDPQYMLIARDGLPLYGGFSGSLGVLSIPPLDLKQIEIIKGSVSTLYGGGAIAGMINFISKQPSDKPRRTLLLNITTLKEKNVNSFFSGKINAKTGYTLFAGANLKSAADVNGDGFTEVPENQNYSIHPRFFFQPGAKTKLNVGLTATIDNRKSGDFTAVKDGVSAAHPYLRKEKTFRNVLDFQVNHNYSPNHVIAFKTAISTYQRELQVPQRSVPDFTFDGRQYSSYSEASDRNLWGKHTLVLGANLITESFRGTRPENFPLANYDYVTTGLFAQDDWDVTRRFTVEAGVRLDHHNIKGYFFLPRIAFFYKPTDKLSVRLASGAGYKAPNVLSLADPDPTLINNGASVMSEHSTGVNADINYSTVCFDEVELSLNQAFYVARITNPIFVITDTLNQVSYMENQPFTARSLGTDTYVQLTFRGWELYLGYNHTEAYHDYTGGKNPMPFNPKDKVAMTLAFGAAEKWRTGIEAAYMADQYVIHSSNYYSSGAIYPSYRVPDFWFWAAMVERKFPFGSVVLNVENLFDSRQSKFGSLVHGPVTNPVFEPVWAPLEGRVINLSVKINL